MCFDNRPRAGRFHQKKKTYYGATHGLQILMDIAEILVEVKRDVKSKWLGNVETQQRATPPMSSRTKLGQFGSL